MNKVNITTAINPFVIDKTEKHWILTSKFRNYSISPEEILDYIQKGHPICSCKLLENDEGFCYRDSDNFVSGQIIGVDIDNKIGDIKLSIAEGYVSYEDALSDPVVTSKASFLYTTKSSTEEHNRFRIIFVLEEPIEDKVQYKTIISHFANYFKGDKVATAVCQIFYGSKNCTSKIFGNVLTTEDVNEILEKEKEKILSKSKSNNKNYIASHDSNFKNNNLEKKDLEEIISYIFKDGHTENDIWFKTISILKNHTILSDEEIRTIVSKYVELGDIDKKLEYAEKYKDVGIGSLIYFAQQNGYIIPNHIKNKNSTFWMIEEDKDKNKVTINYTDLNNHLSANGFRKYRDTFIHIDNMIIEEVKKEDIKKYIFEYIRTYNSITPADKIMIEEKIRKSSNTLFPAIFSNLDFVNEEDIQVKSQDTSDTVFKYFKNGIVQITKQSVLQLPYNSLNYYVWKNQIIQRDYVESDDKLSEIEQYITDVCTNSRNGIFEVPDSERVTLLKKAIGYLLTGYKDPAHSVAIILTDEEISDTPQGRTGKSLLGKMLMQVSQVADIDGRRLNLDNQFSFSNVSPSDKIIFIDDCNKKFDLTNLFHVITGGLTVEKKGRDSIKLEFDQTPKLLLTTNNLINLSGRSSTERVVEIEFSDYYANKTPLEKFGHRLITEWDNKEWARFDNALIRYIQLYLRDGLKQENKNNRKLKTILESIGQAMFEFIENNIEINTAYPTSSVKEAFKEQEELEATEIMSQTAFTQSLRKYAEQYLGFQLLTGHKKKKKCFVITDNKNSKFSAFEIADEYK